MKLIRIIPSLLLRDNNLFKGTNFDHHNYVGDVFNALKIFSEKKAHEIILLDIGARKSKKFINLDLIKKLDKKLLFHYVSVVGLTLLILHLE